MVRVDREVLPQILAITVKVPNALNLHLKIVCWKSTVENMI